MMNETLRPQDCPFLARDATAPGRYDHGCAVRCFRHIRVND